VKKNLRKYENFLASRLKKSDYFIALNAKRTLTFMTSHATRKRPPEIQAARNDLRRKGWSQAAAADRLGVSAIHLCYVLNGHRISRRLLNAIHHLPENSEPA
jgi:hypothetical protein